MRDANFRVFAKTFVRVLYILKTWLLLSRAILAALLQDIFLFDR